MFVTNLHTLLLILGINKFLLGLLIFFLKTKTPNFKGIGYWAYGSIITAIGIIIYAFMPHSVPVLVDFTFSFFLNVFILGGDCLFLAGFWVFSGKPVKKLIMFGIPVLAAINIIIFTLFYNVIWIRFSLNAFIGAGLYLVSAFELQKSPRKSLDNIFKITSGIYLFYAVLQITRGVLGILYKPVDPVGENVATILLVAIAGVLMILLTFNLIIIITTSINDELSEQVRSKNKLYAIISHDLRGPLGNLFNYVQLLKFADSTTESEVKKKYLDEMVKLSLSTRFLLENLFNWSRSQLHEINVQPKEFDLAQHISENCAILKNFADNKNIKIDIDINNSIKARYDSDMIGIVIRNLVLNAIKFTNVNGTIKISSTHIKNYLEINIEDNGVGIEPEKLANIFDEKITFTTPGTKGEKGSGFGLVLCKEFVEMNRGKIKAISKPGKGSNFSFSLPSQNE